MIPNTLFVKRLVVLTSKGLVAYDQQFHKGINIIRGDNSSGKSTISNFIFYVFGGEFNSFVPEAKKCADVYAETEMNGATITLRRSIEFDDFGKLKPRVSIYFFWGPYQEALAPPPDKTWQKFGYNSYPEIKSFSNVIFDNLNIPIVKGDNNITFHQLLRLMYIDQDSPTNSLFLYEVFDSQITRQTVAELLLGIYNDELYQSRRRLIELSREIDDVKSQIKGTKGFFASANDLVPANLNTRIANLESDISEIESQISKLKQDQESKSLSTKQFRHQQLTTQIVTQRRRVDNLKSEISGKELEIADNEFFLTSLRDKIKALKNSITTRDMLQNLPLEYCPDCLTEIRHQETSEETKCKLCKELIDSTYGITQGRRMEQEISFQIIESNTIQQGLKNSLSELKPELKKEEAILEGLQKTYDEEVKGVRSSNQEQIENLYQSRGFLEGEILQLRNIMENAERYQNLLSLRDSLTREKEGIETYIRKTEYELETRQAQITNQVKKEALYFLQNDFNRQEEFKKATDFTIDYANNMAFLSKEYAKYSASSAFYLKLTARFALFIASLSIPSIRYPRFILADNMEDKGIEKERAQNFQKILIERLKDFDPNTYQVIYTTSYITEELNNSEYVVGEYYTAENRSLKNLDS